MHYIHVCIILFERKNIIARVLKRCTKDLHNCAVLSINADCTANTELLHNVTWMNSRFSFIFRIDSDLYSVPYVYNCKMQYYITLSMVISKTTECNFKWYYMKYLLLTIPEPRSTIFNWKFIVKRLKFLEKVSVFWTWRSTVKQHIFL